MLKAVVADVVMLQNATVDVMFLVFSYIDDDVGFQSKCFRMKYETLRESVRWLPCCNRNLYSRKDNASGK